MKKIRLGFIGTGIAFHELHAPVLFELQDHFELVLLCNRTESAAQKTADWVAEHMGARPEVTHDMDEVLERDDIEAVGIAVPIQLNASVAERALKKGKHVLAEKPIADNLDDGRQLIDVAEKSGKVLLIGENFRYQRRFYQARGLVESGTIGQPLLYRLNDLHYTEPNGMYTSTAWRQEGNFTGGYLIDGGVHTIAGMRAMVGSEVSEVHGLEAAFQPEYLSNQSDALLLQLKFASGIVAQVALGYGTVEHDARTPKIYGREGTLVLFEDHIEVWPLSEDDRSQTVSVEKDDRGYREEWLDFYEAVANGAPLFNPPEEALADLQVILAAIESAKSGRVERL